MNVVYQRVIELTWQGAVLHLRGQICVREAQSLTSAHLRHRQSSLTVACHLQANTSSADLHDFHLAADLSSVQLVRGAWDICLIFDHLESREDEVRVNEQFRTDLNEHTLCSRGEFWRLVASFSPQLHFLADPADATAMVLRAFDWTAPRTARLRSEKGALPDGYSVTGLIVEGESGRWQFPLHERPDSPPGCVEAFADLTDSLRTSREFAFVWSLAGPDGAEARVRVAARFAARASNVWALPSQAIEGGPEALVAGFSRSDELIVSRKPILHANAVRLDTRRWKSRGVASIVLSLTPHHNIYLPNHSSLESTFRFDLLLRSANGDEIVCAANVPARCGEHANVEIDVLRWLKRADALAHYRVYVRICGDGDGPDLLLPLSCELLDQRSDYGSFRKNAVRHHGQLFRSLFVDRDSRLNIEIRPRRKVETKRRLVTDVVAKALALVAAAVRPREIWLVGENLGKVAQDNGVAFFEYCRQRKVPERVLYVARKKNAHMDRLAPHEEHVVRYDSFRHHYYYHRANRLIVAHGIRDVMPSLKHSKVNTNKKPVVYLQHGIVAMKRITYNNQSYNGQIRAFVVSSDHEKKILERHNRFDESRLVVTGLPRYDRLVSNPTEKPTFLVMPTWRDWVIRDEATMRDSSFYKEYLGLLTDERMRAMLIEWDAELLFYPHTEIEQRYRHLWNVAGDRVRVLPAAGLPLQDLLRSAWVLITDYSSVAWDFNYMQKPVIFFQFDRSEYLRQRGSYIDLAKELPGAVCESREEVYDRLFKMAATNFAYDASFREKSSRFYRHFDQRNSRRVYEAVRSIKSSK